MTRPISPPSAPPMPPLETAPLADPDVPADAPDNPVMPPPGADYDLRLLKVGRLGRYIGPESEDERFHVT